MGIGGSGRRLGSEDLHRLVLGASVLGTGGGGSFSLAQAIVEDLRTRGLDPELADPQDLPEGALGVSTVLLGGGLSHADLEAMDMLSGEPASLKGAQALARYLGRPIDFVFPIEIGPQNTLEAVRLAAFLGVPVVDGDCVGRAVPEMQQTTLSLCGIPLTPYVVGTFQGDVVLVPSVASDGRSEALCRALAGASGGVICVTGFPAPWARLREALIPGTLTRCMRVGDVLEAGPEPVPRVAEILGGRVAFRGRVRHFEVDASGGFFRGWMVLEGAEGRYQVGFQNEFLWGWLNGRIDIRCPDLVCVVDSATGVGKVTYGHGFAQSVEVGEDLSVLQVPCDAIWRSERGRAAFPFPPPLPAALQD